MNLVVLDLNLNVEDPPVDVPTILDIFPALTTFMFNADWRINPTRRAQLATSLSDLILISQPSAFMGSPAAESCYTFEIPVG
jgi:hypothetical protein